MERDAELRVERTLARIARRGVRGSELVVGLSSAERRRPHREAAERAANQAGRGGLVRDAQAQLRSALDDIYGERAGATGFGSPGDAATADERVAIALALADLVLAAVAEDLIDRSAFRVLSEDAETLLGQAPLAGAADERAGIEVGGRIDPAATPKATAQLVGGIVAAVFLGPLAMLVGWERAGTLVGIVLAVVTIALCLAWAVWPRRRSATAGRGPYGLTNRSGR